MDMKKHYKEQEKLINSLTPSTEIESLLHHLVCNCDNARDEYMYEDDEINELRILSGYNLTMLEKLEKILIDKKVIKEYELRSNHWEIDQDYFIDKEFGE